jgi:hypothetical protein
MIDISGAVALESLHERLCLDFANTSGEHPSRPDDEFLSSYANLVEWSVYSNVLHQDEGEHLLAIADRHPVKQAALHYAVAVRETIYRVLSAAADGMNRRSLTCRPSIYPVQSDAFSAPRGHHRRIRLGLGDGGRRSGKNAVAGDLVSFTTFDVA